MDRTPTNFTVMASGQLQSAEISGCGNAYAKISFYHGDDWQLLDGFEDGITQITRTSDGDMKLIWNFPIEVVYRSTNAFGWPQVALSVYSVDSLGRDIVVGYGATHIPTTTGHHNITVQLYKPLSASYFQQFLSWLTGMPPEFTDPKFPAYGSGREVTRVVSTGTAEVMMHVVTKDMRNFGYVEEDAGYNYNS